MALLMVLLHLLLMKGQLFKVMKVLLREWSFGGVWNFAYSNLQSLDWFLLYCMFVFLYWNCCVSCLTDYNVFIAASTTVPNSSMDIARFLSVTFIVPISNFTSFKREYKHPSPFHILSHALFVLNYLNLDSEDISASQKNLWLSITQKPYG